MARRMRTQPVPMQGGNIFGDIWSGVKTVGRAIKTGADKIGLKPSHVLDAAGALGVPGASVAAKGARAVGYGRGGKRRTVRKRRGGAAPKAAGGARRRRGGAAPKSAPHYVSRAGAIKAPGPGFKTMPYSLNGGIGGNGFKRVGGL